MSSKVIHVDGSYIITNFSNVVSSSATGHTTERNIVTRKLLSKTISFSGAFGSPEAGEVLRISDGVTTISYTVTETGGSSAGGATQIGGGSNRSTADVVTEFVTKITSSALDISATNHGGSSTAASFTLTAGANKVLTVTEDPSPRDGNFGSNVTTTVTDNIETTNYVMAATRFMSNGSYNIRGQGSNNIYRVSIGDKKK